MKVGNILLGATLLLPSWARAETYVVGLAHMEVFNGVCNGPNCTDTDYINLTVTGPNGQVWTKSMGPDDLHKNNRMNWNITSAGINVPNDPSAKLMITWAAINRGHDANSDQVKAAINSAADAYAKSGNTDSSSLAAAIVNGIKSVVGWFAQNCDTPLFQGTEVWDGATLANSGPPGYTPGVPTDLSQYSGSQQEWWHVYGPYSPHPEGCDTGRYNQVVWISKQK